MAAAIAIGASTAVFSAVDRILFRPLRTRASPKWSAYMTTGGAHCEHAIDAFL